MMMAAAAIAGIAGLWAALATWLCVTRKISLHQGFVYAPLKTAFLVRDSAVDRVPRKGGAIYVVAHKSRLDPAIMLCLLPGDTLHILDSYSATSWWMEPFRELARTIAFRADQLYVSRRLVRILRGGGRIAVYLPDEVEPDTRSFRLVRAVARIAARADAMVVPLRLDRRPSVLGGHDGPRTMPWPRAPLRITALAPAGLEELREQGGYPRLTASLALFDRMALARVRAFDPGRSLAVAVASASAELDGADGALEEPGVTIARRDLLTDARLIGAWLAARTEEAEPVGLLAPPAPATVKAFLGIQWAGCVAAMFDPGAGKAVGVAARSAGLRLVLGSRAALAGKSTEELEWALESAGARLVLVEDILGDVSAVGRVLAAIARRRPVRTASADAPAALVHAALSGDDPPHPVRLTHANILAQAAQIAARTVIARHDRLFCALAPARADGLCAGLVLPLLTGARICLPSAASGDVLGEIRPSIVLATGADLDRLVETAGEAGLSALRTAIVSGEPPRIATRERLAELPSLAFLAGSTLDAASGYLSLSSRTHRREGAQGRLMAGMRMAIEPLSGVERGGLLHVSGPNLALAGEARQGWLATGQMVAVDREAYLTFLGRPDRITEIGGKQIPLEISESLASMLWPGERHAASVPESRRRKPRMVLVTTAPSAARQPLKRLAAALGIAEAVLPADIIVADSLPLDQSGSVDLEYARRLAERRLEQASAA